MIVTFRASELNNGAWEIIDQDHIWDERLAHFPGAASGIYIPWVNLHTVWFPLPGQESRPDDVIYWVFPSEAEELWWMLNIPGEYTFVPITDDVHEAILSRLPLIAERWSEGMTK